MYFSEISFENLKCFSGSQTLSLLDRNGRPAMWNLLLGENGVGKTTILQSLVWMRPVEGAGDYLFLQPALMNEEKNSVLENLVRRDTRNMTIAAGFMGSNPKLRTRYVTTGISAQTDTHGKLKKTDPISNKKKKEPDIHIIAYSANRHAGSLNLSEDEIADPISSIFETETTLYDPEAILLALDYGSSKQNVERVLVWRDKVEQLVADILPDVRQTSDIVVKGPAITGKSDEAALIDDDVPF